MSLIDSLKYFLHNAPWISEGILPNLIGKTNQRVCTKQRLRSDWDQSLCCAFNGPKQKLYNQTEPTAPITQLRAFVTKIVTFKGGHLLW